MNKIFTLLAFLVVAQLQAQSVDILMDTIYFDGAANPYFSLDPRPGNLWQVGRPQKIIFDSAYASSQAIVTDTINNYPVNNFSYFDLKFGYFNYVNYYGYSMHLYFQHKYDTDTLLDGGYITVSYDSGQTWVNLLDEHNVNFWWCMTPSTSFRTTNLYGASDTLHNGEKGFSGSSNGWVETHIGWEICPVKSGFNMPDTMLLRFNFVSDSVDTGKEGWMIDQIQLIGIDLGDNVGQLAAPQFSLYPNPVEQAANVELDAFYPEVQAEIYTAQGQLLRRQSYQNTQQLSLFTSDLPQGAYILKIAADTQFLGAKLFKK